MERLIGISPRWIPSWLTFSRQRRGHPIMLNIATIPEWMYKTDKPVPVPANPLELDYEYEKGTETARPFHAGGRRVFWAPGELVHQGWF